MHKDAFLFLVKSQRKVVDQNKEVWVRCQWTKSQDMAENLRFSCLWKPQFWCNTMSLARRRSAQRKTWLVGNQVGIQTIIATLALSKWASLSVVVLFRRGVKSAAELSVQLAPSSQIVALEAMWCDAEGGQTAGEIVPLEGSIQSRAWSRLLFQAFKEGFSRSEVATSWRMSPI